MGATMRDERVAQSVKRLAHAIDDIGDGLHGRTDLESRRLSALLSGFVERFTAAFQRWERSRIERRR